MIRFLKKKFFYIYNETAHYLFYISNMPRILYNAAGKQRKSNRTNSICGETGKYYSGLGVRPRRGTPSVNRPARATPTRADAINIVFTRHVHKNNTPRILT